VLDNRLGGDDGEEPVTGVADSFDGLVEVRHVEEGRRELFARARGVAVGDFVDDRGGEDGVVQVVAVAGVVAARDVEREGGDLGGGDFGDSGADSGLCASDRASRVRSGGWLACC
jgi:hypothetical protein